MVFAATPAAAAKEIEAMAYWFAREMVENVNTLARAHGLTRRPSTGTTGAPA